MREIKAADNLIAEVEGDIAEVDGVLRITTIRIHYKLEVPENKRESLDKVLKVYADKCPAYQSIKGCIDCSWTVEIQE